MESSKPQVLGLESFASVFALLQSLKTGQRGHKLQALGTCLTHSDSDVWFKA